ncbi:MAG: T9SS type A sorting domain-containing protein [Crocinitomicaceae bacterium]
MKNTTKKKDVLLKYSAAAGAFLAAGAVNGQIQYTDVNPDVVLDNTTPQYDMDLDGDLVNDFGFAVQTFSFTTSGISITGSYAGVALGTGNSVAGTMSSTSSGGSQFNVSPITAGNPIDAGNDWGNGGSYGAELMAGNFNIPAFPGYSSDFGNFSGNDIHLGVKFMVGGSTHYGWIRMDVLPDGSQITIKDYAYNTIADLTINAGQTVGIEDVALDSKVHFKTFLDKAVVNVTPDLFGGEINIVDMSGRVLSTVAINDVNTEVSYEGVNAGIYMLVANFESGSTSKKVYIK